MNKAILIGKVESIKKCSTNNVTRVILVTSHKYTEKATGLKKSEKEYHNVVFFDKLSTISATFIKIGGKIAVEGYIKTTGEYINKEGQRCKDKDIIASHFYALDDNRDKIVPDKIDNNVRDEENEYLNSWESSFNR
jgi:single-strand DNA-binding protein